MPSRTLAAASPALSRRGNLRLGAAAAGLLATPAVLRGAQGDLPTAPETLDRPRLRLPALTSNGTRLPVTVEAPQPMEPAHGATVLEVVNPRDPIPGKGAFHFTAANDRAWVAFQARFDEGPSAVVATARCRRHGSFSATTPLQVAPGAGGCSGGPPATPGGPLITFLLQPQREGVVRVTLTNTRRQRFEAAHPIRFV